MSGKEFRQLRKSMGLSQDAIGKALAVPPARYSRRCVAYWEDGRNKIPPAVELLMLIFRQKAKIELVPAEAKKRIRTYESL